MEEYNTCYLSKVFGGDNSKPISERYESFQKEIAVKWRFFQIFESFKLPFDLNSAAAELKITDTKNMF